MICKILNVYVDENRLRIMCPGQIIRMVRVDNVKQWAELGREERYLIINDRRK